MEIICHDCGVSDGYYHTPGCDMERCPFCNGQLISCMCCYKKLEIIDHVRFPKTEGLEPFIYANGLTVELAQKWDDILIEKGLIPFDSEIYN